MIEDSLIGQTLGNYEIKRLLGQGGMANVYFAYDLHLRRPVALKVIPTGKQRQDDFAYRFVQEARAVAKWRHSNITQIYTAGTEDDFHYFAMEYIEGLDLRQLLLGYAADGELVGYKDVVRVGRAIGSALDFAHFQGVIHRDVKPSNVIADRFGRIFLTDFGLAMDVKRDNLGQVFGSAHYVAPEQVFDSSSVGPQTDLYSLGVMLYEMLTGVVPFDAPTPKAVALQHLNAEPPSPRVLNPNLSPTVDAILLRSLEKDPLKRFESGAKMMEHLSPALKETASFNPVMVSRPPLQAGMGLQETRKLSDKSVAERIASQPKPVIWTTDLTNPKKNKISKRNRAKKSERRLLWAALGLSGLVIVILSVALVTSILRPIPMIPGQAGGDELNLTEENNAPAFSEGQAEDRLFFGFGAAVETATPSLGPTVTRTLRPSSTPFPSGTSVPPTPTQSGHLFTLVYNETGFFLHNDTGERVDITPFQFDRLGSNGEVQNRFSGSDWARFNNILRPNFCMSIEISNFQEKIRPDNRCNRTYDALRTAVHNHPFVFWTQIGESSQFRVSWDGEVLGYCDVGAGECDIYVPEFEPVPLEP